MEGTRKQAISLRVAAPDLRKVKRLAQRLGVRDSDADTAPSSDIATE